MAGRHSPPDKTQTEGESLRKGWAILETINAEAVKDTDLYVFTNMTGVGNMEVNAFQRGISSQDDGESLGRHVFT